MKTKSYKTVDAYIGNFPPKVQRHLKQLRATIKKAAPKATEKISYGICAFWMNGPLIYFGGFAKHVSIYPRTAGMIKAYGKEMAPYTAGKGTLKFSLEKPLPIGLITKLIKVRLKEDVLRAKKK